MRLSYDDLGSLESNLFDRLRSGSITVEKYVEEWDALVAFAGWTWPEVLAEIDSRWTRPCRATQPAFLC